MKTIITLLLLSICFAAGAQTVKPFVSVNFISVDRFPQIHTGEINYKGVSYPDVTLGANASFFGIIDFRMGAMFHGFVLKQSTTLTVSAKTFDDVIQYSSFGIAVPVNLSIHTKSDSTVSIGISAGMEYYYPIKNRELYYDKANGNDPVVSMTTYNDFTGNLLFNIGPEITFPGASKLSIAPKFYKSLDTDLRGFNLEFTLFF